jgi:hypothetical protein
MQLDLDVPDVLDVDTPVIFEPTSVSVREKLNRLQTVLALEPREAQRLSALDPLGRCRSG